MVKKKQKKTPHHLSFGLPWVAFGWVLSVAAWADVVTVGPLSSMLMCHICFGLKHEKKNKKTAVWLIWELAVGYCRRCIKLHKYNISGIWSVSFSLPLPVCIDELSASANIENRPDN